MSFASPLPIPVLALLVVALGAAALWSVARAPVSRARRFTLAALRFAVLLAIALFLMRPVIIRPAGPRGIVVPVVVDASRSMAISDDSGATRFARAKALVDGPLSRALDGFRQDKLAIVDDVIALDPRTAPEGSTSDVAAALAQVAERYRGANIPGIVLLSDGAETGAGDLPAGIPPVYAVGVGTDPPRDLEVVSLDVDRDALSGSLVDVSASIVSRGYGRGPVTVRLLANGRPIDVRPMEPVADGLPFRVRFAAPAAEDVPVLYSVEVAPRSDERVSDNNVRSALLQPSGRPRRVLFIEGAPGFEHGFIARAWATDPLLEIDAVVRKGQNDSGQPTFCIQAPPDRAAALVQSMPADRRTLFAYDAVVLGNVGRELLTSEQVEALDAFVSRRGGGLLVFGARSYGPAGIAFASLRDLLPLAGSTALRTDAARVSLERGEPNRVLVTADGARHPLLRLGAGVDPVQAWSAAPVLAAISDAGQPRPGAQVLAMGSSGGALRPLLAVQQYGEGRTMAFTGEATFRWKMQRALDDRLFDTFWRQVARWLSASATDPVTIAPIPDVAPGGRARISTLVRGDSFEPVPGASVEVSIAGPGGHVEQLAARPDADVNGRYVVDWRPRGRGLHVVRATIRRPGAPTARTQRAVLVGGADLEMADPRRHDEVLRRIADATSGKLIDGSNLDVIGAALRKRAAATPTSAVEELWHRPSTFLLLVALLCGEWTLRRRWGLR
jgi:uncharacterized membrane protein